MSKAKPAKAASARQIRREIESSPAMGLGKKRWIADVVASGDISKEDLVRAHRAGEISLSRLDLTADYNSAQGRRKVRESETDVAVGGRKVAEFHLVELPRSAKSGGKS